MDQRFEKLISVFEDNGWDRADPVEVSNDWWFEDIVQLAYRWRPVGKIVYLISLTDPQILSEKVIWSIVATPIVPLDRNFTPIASVTLKDINRIDLTLIVRKVNEAIFS